MPEDVNYTYDPGTGKKNHDSFGFVFGDRSEETTYAYDKTGRVVSVITSGSLPASRTYAYDAVTGALTSVGGAGGYSLTYDGSGRVSTVAGASYTHDSLGRRTASPGRTFAWAGERLITTTGTPNAAYAYDASGQRTRSVVASGSVTTTTTWDYDGITLAGYSAARSDGATWSVDYVTDESGRPFGGVYASGATSVPFLMVTTDRGDARELLDVGGAAFAHYAYDAYGNPTATLSAATTGVSAALASDIASRQVLRYAGYAWDSETSLYYCSQRYYDPRTAAFISKDPARADGEESAYQYCAGDPVGKSDVTGEFAMQFRWPNGWGKAESSRYLLKVLRRNAGYALKNRWRAFSPGGWVKWWIGMVDHKRPWDLKRSTSNVTAKTAWLLGARVSSEDFGNIHYGYVGRAAGFSLSVLRAGGYYAAGRTVRSAVHETFHDGPRVAAGFSLYRLFGSRIRAGGSHCDRWVL